MATVARLVESTLSGKTLAGCFVPENNNEGFTDAAGLTTVTLVNETNDVIAFGAAVPYTKTAVYCSVDTVADKYKDHTVWIEEVATKESKTNRVFKTTKDVPHRIKPDHHNQFEAVFSYSEGKPAFEHVFEQLVDSTVGLNQMGTEKNLTVDITAENESELASTVAMWRDTVGAIVSDRSRFYVCEVNRYELLGLDDEKSSVELEKLNDENILDLLDYDADVSVFDREKHVTAMIKTSGAFGFVARRNNQVTGYGLALRNRVLQCYGEDEETIKQLLATIAAEIMSSEVSLCIREESFPVMAQLHQRAVKSSRIVRLHTRTHPNGIKWSKVACPNMGLHLF